MTTLKSSKGHITIISVNKSFMGHGYKSVNTLEQISYLRMFDCSPSRRSFPNTQNLSLSHFNGSSFRYNRVILLRVKKGGRDYDL